MAKKDLAAMVSGGGLFLGIMTDIVSAMREEGGTDEDIHRLATPDGRPTIREMARLAVTGKRVEASSDTIVHHVENIDRALTPQQALDATGRKQRVNQAVLATMPRGEGDTADVEYFWIRRNATPAEVAAAYNSHNLKPDPIAQAKDNVDHPAFADVHPNACQWQDANGNYCYAAFYRWDDERRVYVYHRGDGWPVDWCFGGVRKSSTTS